jgi:hypothetical protein
LRAADQALRKGAVDWGRLPKGGRLIGLEKPLPAGVKPHAERPKGFSLWQAEADGSMKPLGGDIEVSSVRIAPQSGSIAAVSPDQRLYVAEDPTSGKLRELAKGVEYFPAWDGEGKRLVWSQSKDLDTQSLESYDAKTRKTQTLLPQGLGIAQPIWSPKGDAIVYISTQTGIASLWKLTLADKTTLQLTNRGIQLGQGLPPEFVPPPHEGRILWGGAWLVFDSSDALWATHEDGQRSFRITEGSPQSFGWEESGLLLRWKDTQGQTRYHRFNP